MLARPFAAPAVDTPPASPVLGESEAGDRFDEALEIIQRSYLKEMTREQLLDRGLRALLRDLDPYSFYLDPEEWANQREGLAAEFGGLGVIFDIDATARLPRIRHLLIGSAAGPAGVRRGDLILAVNGRSLEGMDFDQVRSCLVGSPGTTVELILRREGLDTLLHFKAERKIIKTPSVRGVRRDSKGESEYLIDEKRGVGYIRVSRLAEDTVPTVEAALAHLATRHMKSLVLDLRDSSGGFAMAAIGVADLFLESGRILTNVSRDTTAYHDATPGGYTDVPMVVLINSGTASSSEFLAAALADHGRATFIGQRTYGKARIQRMLPLSEGRGGLILTTGLFERPSGKTIDRHDTPEAASHAGVVPDPGFEIIVEGEEYDAWRKEAELRDGAGILEESDFPPSRPDRVLLRALEVLDIERPR